MSNNDESNDDILGLTADIAAAYVTRNSIDPAAVPELIRTIHTALMNIDGAPAPPVEVQKPAAPINRSVQHDYIICLEDGKRLKMLKRYLRARYNLTPDEYRQKWGLPYDYPMVAPAYAQRRSQFAKQIGLGKGK